MVSMIPVPEKAGKKQLNLWISEDTDKALRRLAPQLHLRGRTQLAEVIIQEYLALHKDAPTTRTLRDAADTSATGLKRRKSA